MKAPLEISFKGLEKSRTIEAKVAERAARLERHFDRMTHVRTVISAPNKLIHKAQHYAVKIEIGIPAGAPIIISQEPDGNNPQSDLLIAIRDAFQSAERRLVELSDKLSGSAKKGEKERRRPSRVEAKD